MPEQVNRSVKRYPWLTPSGGGVSSAAGMTAEELKLQQVKPQNAQSTAPIAQRAPLEFIQPTTSSENLRLATPDSPHPFATPLGPRHSHMYSRSAIARAASDLSRMLVAALKNPPARITSDDVDRMRASLSRESAMQKLLVHDQQLKEEIYGRIIGNPQDV